MKIEVQHIFEGVKLVFSSLEGMKFSQIITRKQAVSLADNLILMEAREQESIYQKREAG